MLPNNLHDFGANQLPVVSNNTSLPLQGVQQSQQVVPSSI
jgi:hypothetical protein